MARKRPPASPPFPPEPGDERSRDAARKKAKRAAARDLTIPACKNPRRRKRCERDIFLALPTYFPADYSQEITPQRREMIAAIHESLYDGVDRAVAAPRGDGKTTNAECVATLLACRGEVRFILIVAATGPDAEQILDNIKERLETSDPLCEDYPEVCVPIRDLEGLPNRANGQTVAGERTRIRWSGKAIRLPVIAKSKASGVVIMARGLDGAIRGIRRGEIRPDVVIIDDPETEESAVSPAQIEKRIRTIERALGGLGGPGKRVGRVMLTTCQNRQCLSWQYTDPEQKPGWCGKRMRFLVKPPDRRDLWDEYLTQVRLDQLAGDAFARKAHALYLKNRKAMDAGAEVGNPYRFLPDKLADGTQREVSALEHYFNLVARLGEDAVETEYNNNPKEDEEGPQRQISVHAVQTKTAGLDRRELPKLALKAVTQGIDVGAYGLHWVLCAWQADATGWVLDYGVEETHLNQAAGERAIEPAIRRALAARRQALLEQPLRGADGEPVDVLLTLIDSRYKGRAVFQHCKEAGLAWQPAMGHGESLGCVSKRYFLPKAGPTVKLGQAWYLRKSEGGVWITHADADYWKGWIHDRLMTPIGTPGALCLWGHGLPPGERPGHLSLDQRNHLAFAKHLTNEYEVQDAFARRRFKARSDNVHWLDATYLAAVAAARCGVSIVAGELPPPPRKRVKMSERQAQRRNKG